VAVVVAAEPVCSLTGVPTTMLLAAAMAWQSSAAVVGESLQQLELALALALLQASCLKSDPFVADPN